MMTLGYDCVTIPGAVKNTADMNAAPERICGRQFVTATGMADVAKTICSEFCLPTKTAIIQIRKKNRQPSSLFVCGQYIGRAGLEVELPTTSILACIIIQLYHLALEYYAQNLYKKAVPLFCSSLYAN